MEPVQQLPGTHDAPSTFVLDGTPTTTLTETQAGEVSRRSSVHIIGIATIVQYLVDSPGGVTLTMAGLVEAVKQINTMQRYFESQRPLPSLDWVRIGWAMIADRAVAAELAQHFGPSAQQVSGPQARALNAFLTEWPGFVALLTGTGPGQFRAKVEFGAHVETVHGPGRYSDGTVKLGPMTTETPGMFVRLFLHEAGHATFERHLLGDRTLPVPVDNPDIRPSGPTAEEKAAAWQGQSADAKAVYEAWLVLRRGDGRYLLGLDLGPRGRPQARQLYQARRFGEFCAEVFMQTATAELSDHVRRVQASGAPPEVIDAWKTVVRVLLTCRAAVLGR